MVCPFDDTDLRCLLYCTKILPIFIQVSQDTFVLPYYFEQRMKFGWTGILRFQPACLNRIGFIHYTNFFFFILQSIVDVALI